MCEAAAMGASSKQPSVLREVSDSLREAVLALLVIAAAAGLIFDVFAVIELNTMHPADGLGGEVFFFGIILLLPLQLGAAFVVRGWWQRHQLEKRRSAVVTSEDVPTESVPYTHAAEALEDADDVFERDRADRLVRRAQWLLGVPAAAMMLAALVHALGLSRLYFTLTEPMAVFAWFPSWCAGVVMAVVALSSYGRWMPLALAILYPLLVRGF